MAESSERVKVTNAYLTSHTILETLVLVNSDQKFIMRGPDETD